MNNKFLNLLLSKKALFVLFALASAAILLMFINQPLFTLKPKLDYKFGIKPTFSLNGRLWECIKDRESVSVSITNPINNSIFLTTDTINLVSKLNFECDNLQYSQNWFLNGSNQAFSNSPTAQLSKLPVGRYFITYKADLIKGLTVDSSITIEVKEPIKSQATNPTPIPVPVNPPPVNPPAPVPPPVTYIPPTVSILRPKDGSVYTATQYDKLRNLYATVTFYAAATDPQDGTLSGTSLQWYYIAPGSKTRTYFGTGTTISANLYAPNCANQYTIIVRAKNSHGLYTEYSIKVNITGYCPIIIF